MSVNEKMTAIADGIRELSGSTEKLGLDAMAESVSTGNDEIALQKELLEQAIAELEGKVDPELYDQGYEAGKKSEYDRFWDNFQQSGNLTDYPFAFYGPGWTDENFRPKHNIVPTAFSQTFRGCGVKDAKGCLESTGAVLDTSSAPGFSYSFYNALIERLPVISTVSAGALDNTFHNARQLHTIEKLIFKEDGSQTFSTAFLYCYALENIVIEGTIGNNPGFSSCSKLTHDSLMSIINHLKDYAGTGTTKTLSIGTTNLNKLTEEEKQIATDKGWTLA